MTKKSVLISGLILSQVCFFHRAKADDEVIVVEELDEFGIEEPVAVIIERDVKNSEGDEAKKREEAKALKFSGVIAVDIFGDVVSYGGNRKFRPASIDKDAHSKSPKFFGGGWGCEFGLSKGFELNKEIINLSLGFAAKPATNEAVFTTAAVSKDCSDTSLGWVFGYAQSGFATDDHSVPKVGMEQKIDTSFSYKVAFEQLEEAKIYKKEEKDDKEKKAALEKAQVLKFTDRFPSLAFVTSFKYDKKDVWNTELSGLVSLLQYGEKYNGEAAKKATSETKNDKILPVFGVQLMTNFGKTKGLKTGDWGITNWVKYRQGLGAYTPDGGGLDDKDNSDVFIVGKDSKSLDTVKTVGGCLLYKYGIVSNVIAFASVSSIYALQKAIYKVAEEEISNFRDGHIMTIGGEYHFAKDFAVSLAGNLGIRNLLTPVPAGEQTKPIFRITSCVIFKLA